MWTFGATPTMPKPFEAAAIVPAVCVPWPLSSWAAVPGTGAPLTQFALSATSMFCFRSGWLKSIPVSMSPASTAGLPPVIACASGRLSLVEDDVVGTERRRCGDRRHGRNEAADDEPSHRAPLSPVDQWRGDYKRPSTGRGRGPYVRWK